jgi:hypothetical protein
MKQEEKRDENNSPFILSYTSFGYALDFLRMDGMGYHRTD